MVNNNIHYDFFALAEVRNAGQLKSFEKTHQIIFNSTPSLTNGVALLLRPSILQICDPYLSIDGTIIGTVSKDGVPFVLAVTYLHASDNKTEKLGLILNAIHNMCLPYVSPQILLLGDFNLDSIEKVRSILNREATITSLLKLKVENNYSSPLGNLDTRSGLNNKRQMITSRLDYCISNLNAFISLRFHPDISDHCLFLIESEIQPLRHRKLRLYKRQKITQNILSKPGWTINDSIQNVRTNIGYYTKVLKLTPTNLNINILNLDLPSDVSSSIKIWLDQYRILARDIISMRFSQFQGRAFKLIRRLTKYHNYMKRDGSIATVVRSGDLIEADEDKAHQMIMDTFRVREEHLFNKFLPTPLKTPKILPKLSPSQISSLIAKISKGKALSVLPSLTRFSTLRKIHEP